MVDHHMALVLVQDIQVAGWEEGTAGGQVVAVVVVPVGGRCFAGHNPAAVVAEFARSAALEAGLDSRADCSSTGLDQTCFDL